LIFPPSGPLSDNVPEFHRDPLPETSPGAPPPARFARNAGVAPSLEVVCFW